MLEVPLVQFSLQLRKIKAKALAVGSRKKVDRAPFAFSPSMHQTASPTSSEKARLGAKIFDRSHFGIMIPFVT